MTRLTAVAIALGFVVSACGKDEKKAIEAVGAAASINSSPAGTVKSVLVTADYQKKPVDVLVIRENSGVLRAPEYPFGSRLNQPSSGGVMAFQTLALGLLETLGTEARVGFLDTTFGSYEAMRLGAGHLLKVPPKTPGGTPGGSIIRPQSSLQFIDEILSTSRWTQDQWNQTFFNPMSVVTSLVRTSGETPSTSFGFLRRDAFLSILYVTYSDETFESTEAEDVAEALDGAVGAGNWRVSGILPDRGGCSWKMTNKTERHTNDQGSLPSMDPNYKRKNKIHKLIERTNGVVGSLCKDSYFDSINRFVKEATGAGFFPVTLSDAAEPKSLSVLIDNIPVEGWKYVVKERTVLLPTTIKKGTMIQIAYRVAGGSDEVVSAATPAAENEIPAIKPTQASKAELAFAASIRGILQREGCIGCHPKYNTYENAWDERATMLMAIQRMKGDPLRMPRNATFNADFSTAANFNDLKAWLSE